MRLLMRLLMDGASLVGGPKVTPGLPLSSSPQGVDTPDATIAPPKGRMLLAIVHAVAAGLAAFALLLEPLGFPIAGLVLLLVVSSVGERAALSASIPLACAVIAASLLIFVAALGIPLPLWPATMGRD